MGILERISRLISVVACMLIMFTVAGPSFAKEVALTQDNVGRFLASFEEMKIIALSEGLKTSADPEISKNPIAAVVKAIKSSKLKTQAENIAVRHGFAGIGDWADTGKAIGQAYLYITTGPSRGIARETLEKHKDTAIKELDKLGLLTDKQKQRLKENLEEASERLAREPPKENVAVVSGMKKEIEASVKIAGK